MPNLVTLLLQVAAVVVTARLVGILIRRIGQPQMMGEMRQISNPQHILLWTSRASSMN